MTSAPPREKRLTRRRGIGALVAAGAVAGVALLFAPLPAIERAQFAGPTILDRRGEVLYEPLSRQGSRAEWIDDVPPLIAAATIAAEDARFYRHPGVDAIAIARALVHNAKRGKVVEGGSTITQQVAKMILRSPDRSVPSKLRETWLALRLEARLSKREILRLYVNFAPYGGTIRGVARASRIYFGSDPSQLTVAQAAYLAALPQRPTAFLPSRRVTAAHSRQQHILGRMTELGLITKADYEVARTERLRIASRPDVVSAQHFIDHLDVDPDSSGVIRTTLDVRLQGIVQGIIRSRREELMRHGARSVAVAVLDNATSEWLAWEGSGNYFGHEFGGAIDGVTSLRQPGSTLKPFTYAVALERGGSPADIVPDVPSSFATAEAGVVYSPRNYDGAFRGPLRIREALAGSENVPAVATLAGIGPHSLLRFLRQAGFSNLEQTADYYGLGLTLGDAEVRLSELVAAYSMLARGGVFVAPRALRCGSDSCHVEQRRLLSERTAFWITDILSDDEARAWAFGRGGSLEFPFDVAVKTGTSQAYRDNWTIGYTKDVTVGVWVGNFDRRQLRGSSGVTGAAPIFHDVMLAAARHTDQPILPIPGNVERVEICALSGSRPSMVCPRTVNEWTPAEGAVEFCSWHRPGGDVDWPDRYRAWAFARQPDVPDRAVTPSSHPRAKLAVVNPPDGATYLIDPTLRMAYQKLPLRAVSRTRVQWRVDEKPVGVAPPDGEVAWALRPGEHTITATDTEGNSARVKIWVK